MKEHCGFGEETGSRSRPSGVEHHSQLSTVRRTHANDLVGGPRAVAAQKSQWPPRALQAGSEWSGRSYARRRVCQYEVVRLVANSMAAATIFEGIPN